MRNKSGIAYIVCVVLLVLLTGCDYTELTERDWSLLGKQESTVQKDSRIFSGEIPDFSGDSYAVLNHNIPDFTEEEKRKTESFEQYSPLDSLGRCGEASANLCLELMPETERGEIGQVKPSGWHTVKYPEKINGKPLIDGNYLYNRCHLIAYSLTGENSNEKNLITGTRYMNVEGMLPFENEVREYIVATGNHVLYRVTPVFQGDNLLADGVRMEAWSVEDFGEGVCFDVFCYNVQPYIEIDYATGESRLSEDFSKRTSSGSDEAQKHYVLNTRSKKIHLRSCRSVGDIAEHNKREYDGTMEQLLEWGYSPCGNCLKDVE